VLVTREGTVKLLDFGVAKLLKAESASTDSKTTRVEEMPITPEYAAPEQMLGDMATTATDVYQLGMLLYVLLTRRHPLPLSGSRADRIRQALNGKLPRASEFAAGELRKQLRGDLDAILAKALHGIPEQRYQTAAALHDDLVRYLRREPVSARRQTRFYAFSRLTARHRVATAATLLGVISLCGTLIFALTQGRLASSERDHALALASRNSAVTEFLGTLITEAAEADKPVTVTEMLERSEKLALADISGSPENRAAVLEMIAERIGSLGDPARAARLFENGLSLLANSPDQGLRSEINCEHASVTADLGQADAAQRTLEQELKHLDSEPRVAADCLYFLSNIAASEYQADSALRYAKLALERFRQAPAVAAGDEALMLDAVGYGYHLQGKNREADQYYREAVHKYEQLGRAASADSITVRNKWAIITNDAGAPKRALEIYDGTLRLISERLHGEAPPPYAVGNRARALESIGRYQEARTAYERQLQIAQQRQNVEGQAHAISGLASTALDVHDRTLATHYLAQFDAFVARFMPGSTQVRLWRTIAQARHDLDDGKFADAREGFAQALANSKSAISMTARLGKSEAELRAGNASAAAQDARLALEAATRGQGNLPYSDSTGLSWLALGRAEQKLGHSAEAQNAFHNAEGHLANTVDGDHPALVEARSLLSATRFEPG
jgi:tetratricopeptide (TPR) repeat protein